MTHVPHRGAPNNSMHPTRDTAAVIYLNLVGGRVMPGVRRLEWAARPYELPETALTRLNAQTL